MIILIIVMSIQRIEAIQWSNVILIDRTLINDQTNVSPNLVETEKKCGLSSLDKIHRKWSKKRKEREKCFFNDPINWRRRREQLNCHLKRCREIFQRNPQDQFVDRQKKVSHVAMFVWWEWQRLSIEVTMIQIICRWKESFRSIRWIVHHQINDST